jgi:hypothetical protein
VSRLALDRNAIPAAVAVLLAVLVPLFAGMPTGGGPVTVTGVVSVDATAASAESRAAKPGDVEFPLGGDALRIAREVATSYWQADACGGKVDIAWTLLDEDTNATASWRNPTDAWNNAVANFDCRIDLNPAAGYDFPKLCTVMTHEVGHLLGRQHSVRSGEVMSAIYSDPIEQCVAADPTPPEPEADEDEVLAEVAGPRRASRAPSAKRSLRSGGSTRVAARRAVNRKRCVRRFRAQPRRSSRCGRAVLARRAAHTRVVKRIAH